jgi:hypothetical protein
MHWFVCSQVLEIWHRMQSQLISFSSRAHMMEISEVKFCVAKWPQKRSHSLTFLPSLTFEKCNMDNQLGCSICVLVWLKGIYLTWRGMFGLVFRSANVTLADFYPLTQTKSKKSIWHKPKTLRPILTCTYNTQSINQSINQHREKEITENPKTEKNRSSSTTPIC